MILNRHFDKKTPVQWEENWGSGKLEKYLKKTQLHKNKILEMIMSHSSGAIYYKQR